MAHQEQREVICITDISTSRELESVTSEEVWACYVPVCFWPYFFSVVPGDLLGRLLLLVSMAKSIL